MKKYLVTIELDVQSTDLADIKVQAKNRKEAIKKAIRIYEKGEINLDYYAASNCDSSIADNQDKWNVEEIQ